MKYPDEVSKDVFVYCLLSLAGTVASGHIDLQRKMLMQLGDFRFQKYTSIVGAILQFCFNIVLIIWMKLGICGAALALSLANMAICFGNELYLESYHRIHTGGQKFSMFAQPFTKLKMNSYFECAVPTVLQSFGVHAGMMCLAVYLGQVGNRDDLTTINIFFFFHGMLYQIGRGIQ